jgi:hypothetical protein
MATRHILTVADAVEGDHAIGLRNNNTRRAFAMF